MEPMRVLARAALLFAFVTPALATSGSPDPLFPELHFDDWFQEPANARIHWTASVSDPRLSAHQRLYSTVDMTVDGRELAARRGRGQFVFLIDIADQDGGHWQSHYALDLETVPEGAQSSDYQFVQPLFILPGKYEVSLAVFDSTTATHSTLRRKVHVSALRNDPLAHAWENLPAVEFLSMEDSLDTTYLPHVAGRLNLPLITSRPLQVDLVVNVAPSERFAGSKRMQEMNLAVLVPLTKLLAEADWNNATLNLELLDLNRTQVLFRQNNVKELDWPRARAALTETPAGIIDVKSLENRPNTAAFFTSRIFRRVQRPVPEGAARVVIVLSSENSGSSLAVNFRPAVKAPPPGVKVFYLRYQPSLVTVHRRPGTAFDSIPRPYRLGPEIDRLEPLLKCFNPTLYNATSTDQFRKALSRIMTAIAAM